MVDTDVPSLSLPQVLSPANQTHLCPQVGISWEGRRLGRLESKQRGNLPHPLRQPWTTGESSRLSSWGEV